MLFTPFNVGALVITATKRKSVRKTRVANGRLIVEIIEKLFDMFLHAAAIYAALKVMYVALMCGAIYLVFKALR